MLISAKVWKAEPFYRYLQGLCSFHTGLSTGTVEGQPASYAFWATLCFHTLVKNTRIGFAHSAFSACKVCRNFADLVHFAPGFCEAVGEWLRGYYREIKKRKGHNWFPEGTFKGGDRKGGCFASDAPTKIKNRWATIGFIFVGARWDSNPRHSEPQSDALTN